MLYESRTEMNVYIVPFWQILNENEQDLPMTEAIKKAKRSVCYIGPSRRGEFGGGLRFQGSREDVETAITSLANQ